MKQIKIGGWILMLAVSCAVVMLGLKLRETQEELDSALQSKALLESQLLDLRRVQQKTQIEYDEITKKLAEAASSLKKFESAAVNRSARAKEHRALSKTEIFGMNESSQDSEKTHKEKSANFLKSLGDLFSGEKGETMAKMSADMAVNMNYRQLFDELNLQPTIEEQAREIISKYLTVQMQAGFKMISSNNIEKESLLEEQKNTEKQLRDELAKMLTSDELAKYDRYLHEMPRQSLEQSYEIQLKLSGSTMKPESSDLVKQILAEEVLELIPDYGKPDSISSTDPQSALGSQIMALKRARERVLYKLDADQLVLANQFFNQMEAQLRIAEEMFGQE
jgi:hypothetical protein